MNKKNIIIAFIATFILLVLIFTAYRFGQNNSKPTAITTITPENLTDDWQTYKNEIDGYSFSYPSKYSFTGGALYDDKREGVYSISVNNNPNNLSFISYEQESFSSCINTPSEIGDGCPSFFLTENKLDSNVIKKTLSNIGEVYYRKEAPYVVHINITAWLINNKVYTFSTPSTNYSEEYDQILSTFKFTN